MQALQVGEMVPYRNSMWKVVRVFQAYIGAGGQRYTLENPESHEKVEDLRMRNIYG